MVFRAASESRFRYLCLEYSLHNNTPVLLSFGLLWAYALFENFFFVEKNDEKTAWKNTFFYVGPPKNHSFFLDTF